MSHAELQVRWAYSAIEFAPWPIGADRGRKGCLNLELCKDGGSRHEVEYGEWDIPLKAGFRTHQTVCEKPQELHCPILA